MKFFEEKERFALEQVAERINNLQNADWHGYHGSDFLEPEIFRPIRNGRRISELDWYLGYRDLVTAYPTFLHLEHFDGWKIGMPLSDWTTPLFNAAAYEGIVSTYGLAYWNSVDEDGKRTTRKVATMQLTCPNSEIYCQLIDVSETDEPEVPMIKILMIHNPKKTNAYGLKRFVKRRRFILFEKRGYDFAGGCSLEGDDPRYEINGVDKRFKKHHEMIFEDEEGKCRKVIVTRLAATWEASGMILMPVPDDLIGAAFYSDKYRDHLLKKNKFMEQFLAPVTPSTSNDSIASGKVLHANQ